MLSCGSPLLLLSWCKLCRSESSCHRSTYIDTSCHSCKATAVVEKVEENDVFLWGMLTIHDVLPAAFTAMHSVWAHTKIQLLCMMATNWTKSLWMKLVLLLWHVAIQSVCINCHISAYSMIPCPPHSASDWLGIKIMFHYDSCRAPPFWLCEKPHRNTMSISHRVQSPQQKPWLHTTFQIRLQISCSSSQGPRLHKISLKRE